MTSLFTRFGRANRTTLPPASLGDDSSVRDSLADDLSSLYALAQNSSNVFGSPLGPFEAGGQSHHVPRFVYFGPHTSDESLRLAFYAGFDAQDLRPARSMLRFIERLAEHPEIGQGLNLSFFPLVDVLGAFQGQAGRALAQTSWASSVAPELRLLEQDARLRGYHGFVRLESAPAGDDVMLVKAQGLSSGAMVPTGVELISSEEFEPLAVRFEAHVAYVTDQRSPHGPLSIAEDLPFPPFELTLGIPRDWSELTHRAAVCTVLKRFIRRYRGLHGFGQHI
jgi:hypothetical protein